MGRGQTHRAVAAAMDKAVGTFSSSVKASSKR